MKTTRLVTVLTLAVFVCTSAFAAKGKPAAERLDAAADLMAEMMKTDDKGVPQDLAEQVPLRHPRTGSQEGSVYSRWKIWPRVRRLPQIRRCWLVGARRDSR